MEAREICVRLKLSFAVILTFLFFGLQVLAQNNSVAIRGTPSMLHLCQELLQLYHRDLPTASVSVNVADSIQSLPAGKNSIWQTVQPLDKSQKEQLHDKFGSEARSIPIAIEGVVVIVSRANPISELTVSQLRAIYTGKTRNWKEVGGKDAAIRLYSTEALVGGSLFFTDLVLGGEEIDTTMQGFVTPKETERTVAQDPNGIGLIPLPDDSDVKYPRIRRTADAAAVDATIENIRLLKYPLSSRVYWAIPSQRPEVVTQLVRFTLSPRGQLVAEAAGYYPLSPADRTQALASAGESETRSGGK